MIRTPTPYHLLFSYNAVDPTQRDYMAKEWQLYALEVLSPNMLSKDSIRNAVVSNSILFSLLGKGSRRLRIP